MGRRRWTVDHAVAVLEAAGVVVVVAYLFDLGVRAESRGTVGRTPFDRAFPFLLGLAAGALLIRWAVRSWRAGGRAARPSRSDVPAAPSAEEDSVPFTPAEPLSPDGERELARVVAVLADAGVYAPRVPDPADLCGPVADRGGPITVHGVLMALYEAAFHGPGFDPNAYAANLAFHDSDVEQSAGVVRGQVDDLVRLAAGGLADVAAEVRLVERPGTARVPTTVRLTGGGVERTITYAGAGKYLSTVVHVALARILHGRGTGRRLAWLWSDQGVWLTALPDGAVEQLNALLGPATEDGWEWVDEQEPVAAGAAYPL